MRYIKKFESSEIVLRDSMGEIVLDYLKIIDSGDYDLAKRYLSKWVLLSNGGVIKMIWDGKSYIPSLLLTVKRFISPNLKEYKKKNIIEVTQRLLDEIKNSKELT